MSRVARVIVPCAPYHIVQRGNNRQPIFFDEEDKKEYLSLLNLYCKKWNCDILAYCLMTNHVHLLVEIKSDYSLAKLMQGVSLGYTQKVNKKYHRTGRLWECRYYSCIVERETYLWRVMRYIERNPIRAKLVANAEQYKWSSAKAHLAGEDNSILNNKYLIQSTSREDYKSFINDDENQNDIDFIRQMTYQGKPLGTLQFQHETERILKRKIFFPPPGRPKANIH